MKNLIIFSILCLTLSIYSCKEDDPVDPPMTDACDDARTYTADVKTILDANCATSGCHDATTAANMIDLSDFTNAASEADMDRFLQAIKHQSGVTPMPIGSAKLSDALITEIECWVEQGRPE